MCKAFLFLPQSKKSAVQCFTNKKTVVIKLSPWAFPESSALQHLLKWDAVHEVVHLPVRSEVVNISPAFITSQVWIKSPYQRERAQVPLRRGVFLCFFSPLKTNWKKHIWFPVVSQSGVKEIKSGGKKNPTDNSSVETDLRDVSAADWTCWSSVLEGCWSLVCCWPGT